MRIFKISVYDRDDNQWYFERYAVAESAKKAFGFLSIFDPLKDPIIKYNTNRHTIIYHTKRHSVKFEKMSKPEFYDIKNNPEEFLKELYYEFRLAKSNMIYRYNVDEKFLNRYEKRIKKCMIDEKNSRLERSIWK